MSEDSGGGGGWLLWLGVIVVFNVLSYVFEWGFILY